METADTGVLTTEVRDALAALSRENQGVIFYADSRAFIGLYRETILKCNDAEATTLVFGHKLDFDEDIVAQCLAALRRRCGRDVFVTCNRHGVMTTTGGESVRVPARIQTGYIDVCGAGDACTAGIVSALCAGADNTEAAYFGNLTAGVTVRKIGETGTALSDELRSIRMES